MLIRLPGTEPARRLAARLGRLLRPADAPALVARGDGARDRRDWPAATAAYRAALELEPGWAAIWVQLGHARKEAGDAPGAEAAYRRALRLTPHDPDLLLNLGHLLGRHGGSADAAALLARALDLAPAWRPVVEEGGRALRRRLRELGDRAHLALSARQAATAPLAGAPAGTAGEARGAGAVPRRVGADARPAGDAAGAVPAGDAAGVVPEGGAVGAVPEGGAVGAVPAGGAVDAVPAGGAAGAVPAGGAAGAVPEGGAAGAATPRLPFRLPPAPPPDTGAAAPPASRPVASPPSAAVGTAPPGAPPEPPAPVPPIPAAPPTAPAPMPATPMPATPAPPGPESAPPAPDAPARGARTRPALLVLPPPAPDAAAEAPAGRRLAVAHLARADAALAAGEAEAAARACAAALALDGDDPGGWLRIAEARWQLGHAEGAEAALQRALGLLPATPSAAAGPAAALPQAAPGLGRRSGELDLARRLAELSLARILAETGRAAEIRPPPDWPAALPAPLRAGWAALLGPRLVALEAAARAALARRAGLPPEPGEPDHAWLGRLADRLPPAAAEALLARRAAAAPEDPAPALALAARQEARGAAAEAAATLGGLLWHHPNHGPARTALMRLKRGLNEAARARIGAAHGVDPARLPRGLRFIAFGTTGICNASCIHCPTGKPETAHVPRTTLPMPLFERVVREMAELQLTVGMQVSLGLFGDGLVDPHVVERVRLLRRLMPDAMVSVNTNGAAYDPRRHLALREQVSVVALHVESLRDATYDRLMAPLRLRNVRPKIEAILRDFPGRVHVSVPMSRLNLVEFAAMRSWFTERGAIVVAPDALSSRCAEDRALFDSLSLAPTKVACDTRVAEDLIVDCDGLVTICCQDFRREEPIGDLTRESLVDTLLSEARRKVVAQFAARRHDERATCRRCYADRADVIRGMAGA